ncbi:ankyrin repeat domain-containing protein [Legionella sp. WA2024007413]
MKLSDLTAIVRASEIMYQQVDKSSFKELTEFMGTFSKIYSLFQTRELYKLGNADIPSELKIFFDENDSELDLLTRKTLALADSIDNEFKKFRASKNSSLMGQFFSFFVESDSDRKVSSSSIYNTGMSQTTSGSSVTLDSILKIYNTKDKNVALRKAAHQGSVTHVELLINNFGADINSKSSNGFTALDWAFYNNKMEPQGVFNTLCWLGADQSTLKPLLGKYVTDDESEFPTKDLALARAMKQENQKDIGILVTKYKADTEKAQEILNAETKSLSF